MNFQTLCVLLFFSRSIFYESLSVGLVVCYPEWKSYREKISYRTQCILGKYSFGSFGVFRSEFFIELSERALMGVDIDVVVS